MNVNRRANLVFAFWAASAVLCHAATIVWTNTVSGNWNTAANWDPNQVPAVGDSAIITNSSVTVTLSGSTSVSNITLGANANCGPSTLLSLAGQTLTLTFTQLSGSGNVTLQSATLGP